MPDESGGIFTIALVEGFKGKADVDEDGWVKSGELYNYVKKRVEELSKDRQHPLSSGSQDLKVIQTLKGKEKALKRETEALYTKGELTQIEYEKIKAIVEGKQCRGEGLEYVKEKIKKYLSEGTKEALEDIKTAIKAYESGIRCEGVKEPESEFTQYLSSKPEKAEKYIPEGDSILVLVPKNDALRNAEVYIDGKLADRFEEDVFRIKVTSGKHVVRITSSRIEDLVFGFTVGHKEEYTKEIFGIVARRSITILSEPEGARVYVDGEYKGTTHNDSPLTVYLTVAEKHRIRLEKEDYKPYETTLQIPSKGPVMTLRARLEHLKARLKITSDPPNVEVYLNDNYIGKTPLEYFQEKAIEGELILKKENYADFSLNVNIPLGNSESVSAKLYPIVSVKVETTPSGAKLYVDGKYAGVTPYFANFLGGAEHKIRLEKEEYETIEEVITLPDYPFAVVKSYRLEHLKAHLTIDSTPSDAEVYLNGEYIGKTPLEIIRESPIKGRLTLQKGYLYAEQDVNVALKEEKTIKLKLQPCGVLEIASTPSSADVYIDGTHKGTTPISLRLPVEASYKLKLTKKGYGIVAETITLKESEKDVIVKKVYSLPDYTVYGYVKTPDGKGVPGVRIVFSDGYKPVTTDENGYWEKGLKGEVKIKVEWPEDYIRAVVSHGWGICSDTEPQHPMEKVLFTIDELTGLITAAVLVRPSKSIMDLTVKSVKKKWKAKAFAAGANREIISKGAEMMGKDLSYIIQETITGMQTVADKIGLAGE